jgi:hypothetical protein
MSNQLPQENLNERQNKDEVDRFVNSTGTTKVRYKILVPDAAEQGEKSLETPKTLAQQIEANINKNHCLLEITRHGTGPSTRYTVIAA